MIDTRDNRAGHMFEPLKSMKSVIRLNRDNLYLRIPFFESATGPHYCSACANTRDEVGDLPLRLLPNFRTSSVVVSNGIGRIKILIRFEITLRRFVENLTAQTDSAV